MRISIITPSYQQAAYLPECLRSVAGQQHCEVEHIVVDGGSTDGSRAIIEAHADGLAWWCSEADKGQSDALNKGLAHATGEVFSWLNSDDLLLPGALAEVAAIFASDPRIQVVTGARIRRHPDGRDERMPVESMTDQRAWFIAPMVNQQATFFRMSALRALGGVEAGLHYVMDLELWWRCLFTFGPEAVRVVDRPWAVFRMHEASKSTTSMPGFVKETAALLHQACLDSGSVDLAAVIASGQALRGTIRPLPVGPTHRQVVEEMAIHFLVKWHRGLYTREEFRMMRRLSHLAPAMQERFIVEDREQWDQIRPALRIPAWWIFLLYRKWKHLST
jgi:hypothetical protein